MDRIVYAVWSLDEIVFASLDKKHALSYIAARGGNTTSDDPELKLVPSVADLDELRKGALRRMTVVERLAFQPDDAPVMRSFHRGIQDVFNEFLDEVTKPNKD